MMRTGKRLRLAACLAACMLSAASLSGCGQDEKKRYKIMVIGQSKEPQVADYWKNVEKGAKDAADELGYEVTYLSPQDITKVSDQEGLIDKAKQEGVDAICIAPNNPTKPNAKLKAASRSGIQIFTIDSDVTLDEKSDGFTERRSYIGTNNEAVGGIAARQAAAILAKQGETARAVIICHSSTQNSATQRVNGFQDILNTQIRSQLSIAVQNSEGVLNGTIPPETVETKINSIKGTNYVSEIIYTDGTAKSAREIALKVMNEKPEVKVIFATDEAATEGVCMAVEEAGKKGSISAIGVHCNDKIKKYLEKGVLTATMMLNPYNVGYFAVFYAGSYLVDMETIRDNKKDNIMEDGSVREPSIPKTVDTGALYVTSENLKDEAVQLVLNQIADQQDKDKE